MLRGTHIDGGRLAANLSGIIFASLLKFTNLSFLEQTGTFAVGYLAMRYVAEISSVVADTDQGLEQIPLRSSLGYLLRSYAHMNGAEHRRYPFHCLEFYSQILLPPILLSFVLMVYFRMAVPLMLLFCVLLSAYAGIASHLVLDAYTLSGVLFRNGHVKILCAPTHTTAHFTLKWKFIIPYIHINYVNMDYLDKISGGEHELLIRSNVNVLNKLAFKAMLLICITDFSLLFQTLWEVLF